ncbi:hypothetical protein [Candidatus Rariloculus sp.]|uniref:hypothetical protein n=1 Tax=Candidatus Rariloculus sp. TaxID=3101265 RepID=UPI003D0A5DFD
MSAIVCSLAMTLLGLGVAGAQDSTMSFFITGEGPGDGANLGGLEGADAHCASLAEGAGVTGKTWRAYLSTNAEGGTAVNARDRIGAGPWYNANGVMVAQNVDDLHSDNNQLSKENSVSETGGVINGRGDSPNMHDIITGSNSDGTVADGTCGNWMSNAGDGSASVGHHDREGGGPDPTSWNASHASRGCGQADLQGTGGNGLFYCFAID